MKKTLIAVLILAQSLLPVFTAFAQEINKKDAEAIKEKPADVEIDLERLKETAYSLVNKGKFKEAYDLLLKDYPENKDDIEVNFLLGMSTFKLRKFDEAIKYYQIILNKDPDAHRVRLELARAYTANGQMNEAKKEFNAVLATNPPQVVGENIKRFLEMIEAQKNWYARVSVGFLSDSNVNAGPVAKSVLILGVPFELSTDTRERSFIAIF